MVRFVNMAPEKFFVTRNLKSKKPTSKHTNVSSRVPSKVLPKIVILGAGFGGLYTFLNLRKLLSPKKADITIINRTNYFLFTPLLHEVATGGLAHHQVVEAIRSITYKRGATVHVADVQAVDTKNKVVQTTVGPVSYDILVVATGAQTVFYNIPGAAEHGMILKDLYDAIKIRNHLITRFEQAVETKDAVERKKLLTFVLVGGGATGVELAAEMAEMVSDAFARFFCGKIPKEDVSIHLIAGAPELLQVFHKEVRVRAQEILAREGVKVVFDARVVGVDANGINLSDGSRIETENVIWVAGVGPRVPSVVSGDLPFETKKPNGRIIVDQQLRVKNKEHIFALGDVATFEDENIPMLAQAAVQAAKTAAYNVYALIYGRRMQEFRYHSKGELISLGQWQALGYFWNTLWTGPIAWFLWRMVYLSKFASWPKRIKIAVDWTIDIFYPRDITKA